jgi:hypothetical protein
MAAAIGRETLARSVYRRPASSPTDGRLGWRVLRQLLLQHKAVGGTAIAVARRSASATTAYVVVEGPSGTRAETAGRLPAAETSIVPTPSRTNSAPADSPIKTPRLTRPARTSGERA